ncbi:MAG TPA: lamin tail domain-containing protein [Chondromyces sp.]|nr:lamin tail domain-containing protein [Chondromyces sp.]
MSNRKFPNKVLSLSLASFLAAGTVMPLSSVHKVKAEEKAAYPLISEVYGGGEATSSIPAYKNDFIELYNPTSQSISLEGWTVQYASSGGAFTKKTVLHGTIEPNSYYVIKQAGGSLGKELPGSHDNGEISMSATKGKVALVNNEEEISGLNDENVVDFVGYGSANEYETKAVPSLNNSVSAQRKNPSVDTNNNAEDFSVQPPTPATTGGNEEIPEDEQQPEEAISGLAIHEIQGASHLSPYEGQNVAGVRGIVTAVEEKGGFYLQSLTSDNNPKTSEGIYVYNRSNVEVQQGDIVLVSGEVTEYVNRGAKDTDLTTTEIEANKITVESSENALPEPTILGKGEYVIPTTFIDNDNFSHFDPQEDGIDFFESIEGMYVQLQEAKVVSPTTKYGEVVVVPGNQETDVTDEGALILTEDDFHPERITIDDVLVPNPPEVKTGDYFKEPINGVINYSFSGYKLYNTEKLPEAVNGGVTQETTSLTFDKDELTIASYNVENFSAADAKNHPEKAGKLAKAIAENMESPDIIGLVEMQDNDGSANTGKTDASESYQYLIEEIQKAGGPAYQFTDIAPVDGEDGGQPGGNIRVGFLYNPQRVQLVDKPAGDAVTAVNVNKHGLTLNPGRIDPMHPAFKDSRKALAAEFKFKGSKVVVISNHFNSKGGDDPLFGKNQPPFLESELQRLEIARTINEFVETLQNADPKANVVVLGDLNDFQFSAPLKVLKGQELTNMIDTLPFDEQYTYNYQGNAQVLDHILVSNHLAPFTEADIVHINSSFTESHGRASDHDPVLVQLDLKEARKGKYK